MGQALNALAHPSHQPTTLSKFWLISSFLPRFPVYGSSNSNPLAPRQAFAPGRDATAVSACLWRTSLSGIFPFGLAIVYYSATAPMKSMFILYGLFLMFPLNQNCFVFCILTRSKSQFHHFFLRKKKTKQNKKCMLAYLQDTRMGDLHLMSVTRGHHTHPGKLMDSSLAF